MRIEVENHRLEVNGEFIAELPMLAQDSEVAIYSVPSEYRENGIFYAVNAVNEPAELPASATYELLQVLPLPPHELAVLAQAKLEVLDAAIAEADKMLRELETGCAEREIKTWDQQAIEAASKGDVSREMVESISLYRGLDSSDLIGRINSKSQLYKRMSGAIIGSKQFVEDQIEAAETLDELFAVPTVEERLAEVRQVAES